MRRNGKSRVAVGLTGLLWIVAGAGADCVESDKLHAAGGVEREQFGFDVATDGLTTIVGAPTSDAEAGAAYLFRRVGDAWIQDARLTASDGEPRDHFGGHVAIDGPVAVISASGDDDLGLNAGAAYVFRFDGKEWHEEAKLVAEDGKAEDEFGQAVAVAGDYVMVGAPRHDAAGATSGAVFVFRFDGVSWSARERLIGSDTVAGDLLGEDISMRENVAIAGATGDDDNGTFSGSAFVFRLKGGVWSEEAKLTAADGTPHDLFGASVGISGTEVIVGAFGDRNRDIPFAGAAYTFHESGGSWIETQKLIAIDADASDHFGAATSIDGDIIVINSDSDENGTSAGSVYLFRRFRGRWLEEAKYLSSDGESFDHMGIAVTTRDGAILAGANWDDDLGTNAGAVYAIERCSCPGDVTRDGVVGPTDITKVLANWGGTLVYADVDGDGVVDFGDILTILERWGPCDL